MRAYSFIFVILFIVGAQATPFKTFKKRVQRSANINFAQPPDRQPQSQNVPTPQPKSGPLSPSNGFTQPTGSTSPNGQRPNMTNPNYPPPPGSPPPSGQPPIGLPQTSNMQPSMMLNNLLSSSQSQPPTTPKGPFPSLNESTPSGQPPIGLPQTSNMQPSMMLNNLLSSSQSQPPTTPKGPFPSLNESTPNGQPSLPNGLASSPAPTNLSEGKMKADFEKTDTNRNGGISKEELKAALDAQVKELMAKVSPMTDEKFPSLDTNKNGELDMKEAAGLQETFSKKFMEVFFQQGDNVTIDLPKSFNEADANKNGGVTFDEMKNYIRSLFKDGQAISSDTENQLNLLAISFNQADTDHNSEISLKELETKPQSEQLVKGIFDMMKKSADRPVK